MIVWASAYPVLRRCACCQEAQGEGDGCLEEAHIDSHASSRTENEGSICESTKGLFYTSSPGMQERGCLKEPQLSCPDRYAKNSDILHSGIGAKQVRDK